jgi:hypothetical protein
VIADGQVGSLVQIVDWGAGSSLELTQVKREQEQDGHRGVADEGEGEDTGGSPSFLLGSDVWSSMYVVVALITASLWRFLPNACWTNHDCGYPSLSHFGLMTQNRAR